MENASKALIIAGAILITILIIGLGVYFVNIARGSLGGANLDAQKAETHNQAFTAYFGDRKTATDVKNLMSAIQSANITGAKNGEDYKIYINDQFSTSKSIKTAATVSGLVKNGQTYKIEIDDSGSACTTDAEDTTATANSADTHNYYSNGYIRLIKISQ